MGGGDALNVRILRAMFQGQDLAPVNTRIRSSLRAIAAELGVSEGTVRNRIMQFRKSGFIKDARLIPNPSLLGLAEATVMVEVPHEGVKDEIADELRLLEDTIVVAVFQDRLVSTIFRYRGEPALVRRIDLIRRLAKVDRATVGRVVFPPCTVPVSNSDWALLRAFHLDPTRTYASVAAELRASSRTVKRKLERLLRGCAAFVWPAFDVRQAPEGTQGVLMVQYPIDMKPAIDRQITTRFADFIFLVFHMLPYRESDPALCAYNIIVPNVPKGNDMVREIQAIRGVRAARVEWFERLEALYEPFTEDLRNAPQRNSFVVPREGMRTAPVLRGQG